MIRCQTKVLLYWLQVSLQPDCKNLGSGVPILMAADKPCPQLQPSLIPKPSTYSYDKNFWSKLLVFLNFWGRNFVRRRKQHQNSRIILIGILIEFWASHEILCCMKDFQIMRSQVCNAYEYANSPAKFQHKCYKMHLEIQKCNLFSDFNLGR